MILKALQSEQFTFKFHSLGSKLSKIPEFNLSIFNPTKVHVQKDMISPAETHDKCNPEDLNRELKCAMSKRYLTCRPDQCGTGLRFRCDCSVYE